MPQKTIALMEGFPTSKIQWVIVKLLLWYLTVFFMTGLGEKASDVRFHLLAAEFISSASFAGQHWTFHLLYSVSRQRKRDIEFASFEDSKLRFRFGNTVN
jgi:hypothetical protein